MLKASVTGEYAPDSSAAAATLTLNGGDLKLKASLSEAAFDVGPSLSNLILSLEKPASFSVDYNLPKQDLRFQFMNKGKVLNREVNMTYTHWMKENRTIMDGTLVIDDKNKVSGNYDMNSGNCKLKYSYVQGGVRTFEPCYDLANNAWDFSVSQRVYGDDFLEASYRTSSKVLGLEWSRANPFYGSLKVLASLNLAEKSKIPQIRAESTWNLDI